MSEMVDRIAMVLQASCPREGMHRDVAEHMARCAISAMREPTADILASVSSIDGTDFDEQTAETWRKMIDAALSTTPADR